MENKHIIVMLLIIITILAIGVGVAFLQNVNAKEPCKITIMGNKTISEGDSLSIKLTDLNKTPISKEIVNVTITNSKGKVVVDDVFKTNSKGVAKINLDLKKGKYIVNASYGGNQNYTGNKTSKNITIKEEEKVVESTPEVSQTADTNSGDTQNTNTNSYSIESNMGPDGLEYGRIYDDEGREYIYEDQGGYVNILDEEGHGVSVDYDGNVIGTHEV